MNILIPNVTYITGFVTAKSLKANHHNIFATLTPIFRPAQLRTPFFDRLFYKKMMFLFDDVFDIQVPYSDDEEADYINRILKICKQNNIDAIYPLSDKEILTFAEYREVFEKQNISIAANESGVLKTATNKYEVFEIADEVGYPCPRTVKCTSLQETLEASTKIGFPLILKPYISGGGSYDVMFIQDQEQLFTEFTRISRKVDKLILQEYIPGDKERSLNIVLDSQKNVLLSFTLRKLRHIKPSLSTAVQVVENPPEMAKAIALVQRLGIVGFCAVQTKLDEKDNQFKLIEVNPRLGSNTRILKSFGNDLPLICFNLLLNQAPQNITPYQIGSKGAAPFDDFLALLVFLYLKLKNPRSREIRKSSFNKLPSLTAMLNSYLNFYTRKPVFDDYITSIIDDPVMTLRFYAWLFKAIKTLPEHFEEFIPWGDI